MLQKKKPLGSFSFPRLKERALAPACLQETRCAGSAAPVPLRRTRRRCGLVLLFQMDRAIRTEL
eukprot:5062458-Pyramimonas_sp.AAC.1